MCTGTLLIFHCFQAYHLCVTVGCNLCVLLLGAICGSAQSMDRAAQSIDPYLRRNPWIGQVSCLRNLWILHIMQNDINTVIPRWRRHIYGPEPGRNTLYLSTSVLKYNL